MIIIVNVKCQKNVLCCAQSEKIADILLNKKKFSFNFKLNKFRHCHTGYPPINNDLSLNILLISYFVVIKKQIGNHCPLILDILTNIYISSFLHMVISLIWYSLIVIKKIFNY